MIKFFSLILTFTISIHSFCQSLDQLKKDSDSPIVIYNKSSETKYSFSVDDKTKTIQAQETKLDQIQNNTKEYLGYKNRVYYDDFSKVHKKTVLSKATDSWNCFHPNEEDGIFISGVECCEMTKILNPKQFFTFGYTQDYSDAKFLTSHYFNPGYPTLEYEVTFRIPNNIEIELKEYNFDKAKITKVIKEKGNGDKIITYTVNNFIPFKGEKDMPGASHSIPHILILTKYANYKNEKIQGIENVQDQYSWYASLIKGMSNDKNSIKTKSLELTKNKSTDADKIEALYSWVQKNITYIAYEDGIAGFQPESCQDVYQKKYGDCKGMANLLKNMLNSIGYDARLAWVGMNDLRHDYSTPSLSVDNHMICTIQLNNKWTYLDATGEFNKIDQSPYYLRGRQTLIEDGPKYILNTIEDTWNDQEEKSVFSLTFSTSNLKGNVTKTIHGAYKQHLLTEIQGQPKDIKELVFRSELSQGNPNLDISLTDKQVINKEQPTTLNGEVTWNNSVSKFGDKYYVNFSPLMKQDPYDKDRTFGVLLGLKGIEKIVTQIKIPNDYKINNLPEDIEIENKYYHVSGKFKQNGQNITFTFSKETKLLNLDRKDLEQYNKDIKTINEEIIDNRIIITQ